MELSEQIRREYEHGGGTIRGIAGSWGFIGAWTWRQRSVRFRLNVRDRYVRARSSSQRGFYPRGRKTSRPRPSGRGYKALNALFSLLGRNSANTGEFATPSHSE